MAENLELVQKGFRILHPYFAGYVCQEMSHQYRTGWWQEVLTVLSDQTRDLPDSGSYAELVDSLDIANCIRLFDRCWNDVFRKKLSIDYRTWAKELMGVRNKTAHIGQVDFPENDTWRALDTMSRLCDAFDNEAAEEIRSLLRQFRYGSEKGSTAVTNTASTPQQSKSNAAAVLKSSASGLPSWRDVIEPHPDVAQGRYKNAEFAADLAQVSRGEGSFEYRDPVEFFARTYVTEGMSGLLVQGFKRVSGRDGEPVIQLKTAFGGGKTHSMLALYHAMRGNVSVDKVPNLKPVLEAAGLSGLPKANVAVLVGTSLDPTKSKRPVNFPGITISTLWGEMAAQLAASAGDPSLYDFVKDADKKGWPMRKSSTVSRDFPPAASITSSPLSRRSPRLHAPAKTAWWWRLFRNPISRSAERPARSPWRRSSTPSAEWNPSGSRSRPMKALRSCGAGSSSTARTRRAGIMSAGSSAACIMRVPATSRPRPRRSNTASA